MKTMPWVLFRTNAAWYQKVHAQVDQVFLKTGQREEAGYDSTISRDRMQRVAIKKIMQRESSENASFEIQRSYSIVIMSTAAT